MRQNKMVNASKFVKDYNQSVHQKALIVFSWEAILTHMLFIMLDLNISELIELRVEKQSELNIPGTYIFFILLWFFFEATICPEEILSYNILDICSFSVWSLPVCCAWAFRSNVSAEAINLWLFQWCSRMVGMVHIYTAPLLENHSVFPSSYQWFAYWTEFSKPVFTESAGTYFLQSVWCTGTLQWTIRLWFQELLCIV